MACGQVKLVDKIKQSSYLCIILHVKYKKISILILGKIQDGDHVW